MTASALKKPKSDPFAFLRKAGFVPPSEIARRLGVDTSTVTRWAQNKEVVSREYLGRHFVSLRSVILDKVGLENAVDVGLITKEQAKQFVGKKKGD